MHDIKMKIISEINLECKKYIYGWIYFIVILILTKAWNKEKSSGWSFTSDVGLPYGSLWGPS